MTTATQNRKPQTCSRVGTGTWCQETYDTVSRDAGRRAKELRRLGYAVSVSSLGMQVTPLGLLKMTMVDIRPGANDGVYDMPTDTTDLVEWPR